MSLVLICTDLISDRANSKFDLKIKKALDIN